MANACLVVDNNAETGRVAASSQVLTMPASNLLTPHPSTRWRSLSSADYFVLDKLAASSGDTLFIGGITASTAATARLRLSTADPTGAAGNVLDTGVLANGSAYFDVSYGAFVYQLPAPASYRYLRFDLSDPGASFVEAGCVLDGLATRFKYNFSPGDTIQHVDRSRAEKTASGMTLTWDDNVYRQVSLSFNSVTTAERYGAIERLDRVKGKKRNVLLIADPASSNLPRDTIFGLVSDLTPVAFGRALDLSGNPLFAKQLRIEERI